MAALADRRREALLVSIPLPLLFRTSAAAASGSFVVK
jgi:hypothetical protein